LSSASKAERDDAWRALYEAQFDKIYGFVYRSGVTPSDVEDVTQKVFVVAYKRFVEVQTSPSAPPIENVPAWIRGIAIRVISHHHRYRRLRRLRDWLFYTAEEEVASPPPTPEANAEATEAQRRISEVLSRMSAKLRPVLVLLDLEGVSLEQAALALEIPLNTVRSRRRLAREEFKRLWDQRFGGSPR
jgi:RNA polymerase sigma-70 factor (ECF subfamily)